MIGKVNLFFVIRLIDFHNPQDLRLAFAVVSQLRTHIDFETYQRLIHKMKDEAYELWVFEEDSEIKGIMSLRPYTDFVRGTHLYIDDLVVDEKFRSQKIGAKLLALAEEETKKRGLPSLRLACALSNTGGMKFYEREGWTKRSYSYVKKI